MWNIVYAFVVIIGLVYYFFRRRYNYWNAKGVYTLNPTIPFGNVKDNLLGRQQIGVTLCDGYFEVKKQPYVGIFMIHRPTLVVNDIALVKTMLTKDFIHFSDHGFPVNEEKEPLSGHLFNIGGVKWRNLRVKLTPTFTSSKMRLMFNMLASCAQEMDEYLSKIAEEDKPEEVKEIMGKFGNDVIAKCAFGIECNSFKNPDDIFRRMGKKIFELTFIQSIFAFFDFYCPHLITSFKAMIFKENEDFFYNIVENTVTYREKNGIVRNDFMNLLMQLKNSGRILDDEDNASGKYKLNYCYFIIDCFMSDTLRIAASSC